MGLARQNVQREKTDLVANKEPKDRWRKHRTTIKNTYVQDIPNYPAPIDLLRNNKTYMEKLFAHGELIADYIVSKYGFPKLSFFSYNTLNEHTVPTDMFLDNFVTDYLLNIICSGTKIKPVLQDLEQRFLNSNLFNGDSEQYIMPIYETNAKHWTLLLINVIEKSVSHYDPLGENMRASRKYFGQCQKKFSEELRLITGKNFPLQEDIFNCGVYILYYALCISGKGEWSPRIDPMAYRMDFKKLISDTSEDLSNCCLYCGVLSSTAKTNSCTQCSRKDHIICLAREDRTSTYVCEICKRKR